MGDEKCHQECDENTNKVLQFLQKSLTFKQVRHKFTSIAKGIMSDTPWVETGNIILCLMVDLFLGIMVSFYIKRTYPNLYHVVHGKIEDLLVILLQILEWLSGAPAGLKLNASLNSLLGRFFSYNLHLWRNYIKILEPVLDFLLSSITDVGLLAGLTVQIALVKDLVSVTTFHIYCLYIYATRLWNVELNALKSLGHLFFGRKWNPLRNRVDSVHLSHSEMFLSSLSFTIAVFLSPTILIYYIVFLGLRLPILLVESILKFTIETTNSFEILSAFLALINSPLVPHEICLEPVAFTSTAKASSSKSRSNKTIVRFTVPSQLSKQKTSNNNGNGNV